MSARAIDLASATADSLPEVLTGLWRSGCGRLDVSIACAPIGPHAEGAVTVRPISVWTNLITLSGFEIVSEHDDPEIETDAADGWSASQHWHRFDPFRSGARSARKTLVICRNGTARPDATKHEEMRRVLGARPGATLRPRALDQDSHLVFLVGTYQEFRQYQALWAVLPAHSFTVLLREGGADPGWIRRRRCMEAWLSARSMPWRAVADVSSVPWDVWPQRHRMFVVGADSNVFRSHLLNGAFVAAARYRGWKTVQLQHGIWPYADVIAPLTVMSELVLAWSSEFKKALNEIVTWPDGSRGLRGDIAGVRFDSVGCAAFDRYADAYWPRLEDLLGDWVTSFRRKVLVATNLHWSQHRAGELVNPAILDLARRHEDTLFIVKTHPAHDPDDAFVRACPRNVQVLDEFCCLFADLDSARLVLAVDAVISTLSTVALEAAVARRPFLVIDTGNPNGYEHVETVPPERLPDAYAALFERSPDADAFVSHYIASGSVGRAARNVIEAMARELARPAGLAPNAASLRAFTELASTQAVEAFAQQARIDALEDRHIELDAAIRDQQELHRRERRRVECLRDALVHRDADRLTGLSRPARIALFGASAAGTRDVARLSGHAGVRIECLFDNDPSRWNTSVAGVRVRKPDAPAFAAVDFIVISSVHVEEIARQVIDAGHGKRVVPDVDALLDALALAATRPWQDPVTAASTPARLR
jgi:hypothetical protein